MSAAAAMARRLQEVCRLAAGGGGGVPRRAWRRLRGDAVSFDPGVSDQPAHRSRRIGDERCLGTHEGDVARALVEHLGAHKTCSVR